VLDAAAGKNSINRSTQDHFNEVAIHERVLIGEGEDADWTCVSLRAVVAHLCKACPHFAKIMLAAAVLNGGKQRTCMYSVCGLSVLRKSGGYRFRPKLYIVSSTDLPARAHAHLHASAHAGGLLHLILYGDGVVPGAVLSPENRRKVFVWYASFLEFGNLLAYEELWFCLAMARTRACILT
jgi:hypothetical protein